MKIVLIGNSTYCTYLHFLTINEWRIRLMSNLQKVYIHKFRLWWQSQKVMCIDLEFGNHIMTKWFELLWWSSVWLAAAAICQKLKDFRRNRFSKIAIQCSLVGKWKWGPRLQFAFVSDNDILISYELVKRNQKMFYYTNWFQ